MCLSSYPWDQTNVLLEVLYSTSTTVAVLIVFLLSSICDSLIFSNHREEKNPPHHSLQLPKQTDDLWHVACADMPAFDIICAELTHSVVFFFVLPVLTWWALKENIAETPVTPLSVKSLSVHISVP